MNVVQVRKLALSLFLMPIFMTSADVTDGEKDIRCSVPGITLGKLFGISNSSVEALVTNTNSSYISGCRFKLSEKYYDFDAATFFCDTYFARSTVTNKVTMDVSTVMNRKLREWGVSLDYDCSSIRSYEEFHHAFSNVVNFVGESIGCELECPANDTPQSYIKSSRRLLCSGNGNVNITLTLNIDLGDKYRIVITGKEPLFVKRGKDCILVNPAFISCCFKNQEFGYSRVDRQTRVNQQKVKPEVIDIGIDSYANFVDSFRAAQQGRNGDYSPKIIHSRFEKSKGENCVEQSDVQAYSDRATQRQELLRMQEELRRQRELREK